MQKPWNDDELYYIAEKIKRGMDYDSVASGLRATGFSPCDRSREAVRQKWYDIRDGRESVSSVLTRNVAKRDDHTILVADNDREDPIEEVLDRSIRKTEKAVQRASELPYALAKIMTDVPIALAFVSDQHISMSQATNMKRMMADAQLIKDTPGLYAVLGGDGVDNHIKHRRALINSGSTPEEEWRLYNHYLGILGYKTLAMISGNHDDWSVQFAGIDMVAHLAKRHKIHYAPDEVVVTVKLVEDADDDGQEYTIKVRHKYRYNSSLNLLHTVKRMYDMGGDIFDVGVVCHHHETAMETFRRHEKRRIAFRPGSYQAQTGYGRSIGYNRAVPTCPTVVLFPRFRKLVPFEDVADAAVFLHAVRSRDSVDPALAATG